MATRVDHEQPILHRPKNCLRPGFTSCDLLIELLDVSPRCDPFSPADDRDPRECDADYSQKQPRHLALILPQPITETAHAFDYVGCFAEFFAQPPHVCIDGACVND